MRIDEVPEEVRLKIEKECLAKLVLERGAGRPGLDSRDIRERFFLRYASPVFVLGFIGFVIFGILRVIVVKGGIFDDRKHGLLF